MGVKSNVKNQQFCALKLQLWMNVPPKKIHAMAKVPMFFISFYSKTVLLYLLEQMALLGFLPTTLCHGVKGKRRDDMSLSGFEPLSVELHQIGTFAMLY